MRIPSRQGMVGDAVQDATTAKLKALAAQMCSADKPYFTEGPYGVHSFTSQGNAASFVCNNGDTGSCDDHGCQSHPGPPPSLPASDPAAPQATSDGPGAGALALGLLAVGGLGYGAWRLWRRR